MEQRATKQQSNKTKNNVKKKKDVIHISGEKSCLHENLRGILARQS
jgi:hypothetical protein